MNFTLGPGIFFVELLAGRPNPKTGESDVEKVFDCPLKELNDALSLAMTPHGHCDWWVLGCDPIQGHLLVKCRLTNRTGLVKDATTEELLMANTKNFTSYPWTEPDRVSQTLLKPHVMALAKQSQSLSGLLRQSQPLASRRAE